MRVPFILLFLTGVLFSAEPIWVEGESAAESDVAKHPWYHGQVKMGELSGGEFLSHFSDEKEGRAAYLVEVPEAGTYELWLRANPVKCRMTLRIDKRDGQDLDLTIKQAGNTNIATDGKPDLRFLAWSRAGTFDLGRGKHRLEFRFVSDLSHHGAIDCFVLAAPGFQPMGILKPEEIARREADLIKRNEGWLPWMPDRKAEGAPLLDLRGLNEGVAGENGGIVARDNQFVFRDTGEPVRFWAVNGPPHDLHGEELARCARMLAARGVNLVRLHGKVFDERTGELDRAKVKHIREIVAAMKKEGIYSHLSIYFPLWMKPKPGPGWREGYDGNQHPFALLYFEPEFQAIYRSWLSAVLFGDGALSADPAVFGVELVNEDSFFFWTSSAKNIPDPQLRKLEKLFGNWAAKKHGSIAKAIETWGGMEHPRDGGGRLGFRELWNIVNERKPRDLDTAAFLWETQHGFYQETTGWLRGRGFRGLVTASNWQTAENRILGPLEKSSYASGDFIDRHGYFGCSHSGDNAAWSIRDGHSYRDRSALRFEPEKAGVPKVFSNPVMDTEINGMPSMISETTFNRPNRFRTEAPWVFAAYGALQGTDAIVHFALDSADWAVKPGFFMQPWTLMSPTQAGQFPAAALIYRNGLVREGAMIADFALPMDDALALKGSPMVHAANLDELRKADLPEGGGVTSAVEIMDPLVHFVGRTSLRIGGKGESLVLDVSRWIDREKQTVTSETGELFLDYGNGRLELRAPGAQGAVGALAASGTIETADLTIRSSMELGAVVAVSLDGKPLRTSERILVQVMSEEKGTGFATESLPDGRERITSIGTDPWLIRRLEGEIRLKRADVASLHVTAMDIEGRRTETMAMGEGLRFLPNRAYYLIRTTDAR
ncbi:MAG: hypothetical protein H7A49_02560 [Akkermansiaceae bacterium]|nr:hypothetical protein [Akkermansiaceae bacterium]MCP5542770.1 hypothetical protein [Akkermansiaceae bacterium]MCP5548812.1 hypothetical protein [Akkermansiaceae bacterium]